MKIAKVVISIVLLVSLLVIPVYAEDYTFGFLSEYGFQQQKQSQWCWVACARNSVRFERTILRSQKSAVEKIKGDVVNETGTINEIRRAAEYISYDNEDYVAIKKSFSFENLKQQIKRGNITITCCGRYNQNGDKIGGHAVVVTGYLENEQNNYIYYFDPFDGVSYTCSYTEFCNGTLNNMKYEATVYNNE